MASDQQRRSYHLYVGVDVAAKSVRVWWQDLPRVRSFAQSADGFAALCRQLESTGVTRDQVLLVMEATGT